MPLDHRLIKQRRDHLMLTQAEAAGRAGFSRARWNDIESGTEGKLNVKVNTLEAIAEALVVEPGVLLRPRRRRVRRST